MLFVIVANTEPKGGVLMTNKEIRRSLSDFENLQADIYGHLEADLVKLRVLETMVMGDFFSETIQSDISLLLEDIIATLQTHLLELKKYSDSIFQFRVSIPKE